MNACASQIEYIYRPFPTLVSRRMQDIAQHNVVNCGCKQRCLYKVHIPPYKAGQIKADKLNSDSKTLHDYVGHSVQHSHGKSHAYTAAVHIATCTFDNYSF